MKNSATSGAIELDSEVFVTLAKCVASIGEPEFARNMSNLCMDLGNAEIVYLCAFFNDASPRELYTSRTDEDYLNSMRVYLASAYVLDPFYDLFYQGSDDGVFRLDDFAPDDFRKSEYFRTFYDSLHLKDESGMLINISDGAAVFFSFGNSAIRTLTSNGKLQALLPLISALARRNWNILTPDQTDGSGRMKAHLQSSFRNFGRSILSPRECEISQLIMKGHSTKSIARLFDNSPETIKVHRKRVYSKLGVGTQGELMWLFLDTLGQTPIAFEGDPLEYVRPN